MTAELSSERMQKRFEEVADYFFLLSEPMRLKILYALCDNERAVADLVAQIASTQANVSRHLNLLYRAKVLARRKEGTQVYYRIGDQQTLQLCRTVCGEMVGGTPCASEPAAGGAPGAAQLG